MLVLKRKDGQGVTLFQGGKTIAVITVFDRGDGALRLGFNAPRSVEITRNELLTTEGEKHGSTTSIF